MTVKMRMSMKRKKHVKIEYDNSRVAYSAQNMQERLFNERRRAEASKRVLEAKTRRWVAQAA